MTQHCEYEMTICVRSCAFYDKGRNWKSREKSRVEWEDRIFVNPWNSLILEIAFFLKKEDKIHDAVCFLCFRNKKKKKNIFAVYVCSLFSTFRFVFFFLFCFGSCIIWVNVFYKWNLCKLLAFPFCTVK